MSVNIPQLLDLIQKVAAAALAGAPAVIEVGRALAAFVQSLAPTLAEDDQRKLQQALPDLLAAMNAAVVQAIDDLGGRAA